MQTLIFPLKSEKVVTEAQREREYYEALARARKRRYLLRLRLRVFGKRKTRG